VAAVHIKIPVVYKGCRYGRKIETNRLLRKVFLCAIPGTDVMIFKIFSQKHQAKILAFWAQTTDSLRKNTNFLHRNWQTPQEVVFGYFS
jgi:hypothetical protein